MDLKQLRQKYPEYNDMSDEEFTSSFHKKFYSDMPVETFHKKIGYQQKAQELDTSFEGFKKGPIPSNVIGAGEAGLAMLAGLPSQIAGGLVGLGSLLTGQGLETAAGDVERIQKENFGLGAYIPSTEKGKEYTKTVGDVFAYPGEKAGDLGAAIGRPFGKEELGRLTLQLPVDTAMNFLPLGAVYGGAKGAVKGTLKARELLSKEKPVEATKPSYADIVAEEKVTQQTTDAGPYKRYKHGEIQPDTDAQQVKLLEQEIAQQQIDARQKVMEQDVARQTTLDFNAAERARRDSAPTGYDAWVEAQRQAIGGDQGVNTPINWPRKVADRSPDVTTSPLGEGFRYEGALDPGLNDARSLPIEIADTLRTGETPIDPFNRYSPQQMANRILDQGDLLNQIKQRTDSAKTPEDTTNFEGEGNNPVTPRQPAPAPKEDLTGTWFGEGGRFNKQRGALFFNKKGTLPSSIEDLKLAVGKAIKSTPIASPERMKVLDAAGLKGTAYDRVQTVEDVLKNPGKDLQPVLRGVIDAVQSGLEGTLRHNPKNAGINFARNQFQEARNLAEQLSKRYITDAKTGLNAELNKLSMKEKTDVVGLMLELDRQQVDLSDSVMTRAGFNDKQKSVALRMKEANDALYAEKNKVLGELGYDAHPYRPGHMPGNFGGAYKTLIGYKDKDGNFHITGIAQADTAWGHKKALEWYRSQNDPKFKTEIDFGRQGVNSRTGRNGYDGFADLVAEIAKHDPTFADTLKMAEQHGSDSIASLYNFQVHEKAKKGIVGSYGNRPWLDKEQNTREFIKSYIDYLEQGYKYTAYQRPLNEVNKLLRDPDYRTSHPRTAAYIQKYIKHVTGTDLNPIGAAGNWAIDKTASMAGLGNGQFSKANQELAQASTLHMMGVFNPGFLLAQLTQWATGGVPEAMAIRATLKQDPQLMINSLQRTVSDAAALSIEAQTGKVVKDVPEHIREAYQWGHDNGLFTFSEVALAHQVLQSKARRKIEPFLDWPIRLGEQATRPVIFLTFVDMFHNAGFPTKDALLRAQAATDYAMVNYHPDERPMIYQSLGALGTSMGALSTYKHNLVSQYGARAGEALSKPAAAVSMLGLGYALYGVSGLPGYQEASSMAEAITDKPLRELLLDNPKEANSVMDGLLSAKTGLDFQSRLSMSSVLPDSPLSAFPHISNFVNIMDKAYDFAKNPDQGSGEELAKAVTPAGARGFVESQINPKQINPETGVLESMPLDKTGKNKYDQGRSPEEVKLRELLGVRPFREKLMDEKIWNTRVSEAKRQDKLKDAQMRFDRAFLKNDVAGMAAAEDDYTKYDGDLRTLYNSTRLRDMQTGAMMSEETRRAGKPASNLNTLKRYEEFTK